VKKIAVTMWDGWISPVFDVCTEALILELEGGEVSSRSSIDLRAVEPSEKLRRLVDQRVAALICGAISAQVQAEAEALGLEVMGFTAGQIDEVVGAYLRGGLPAPEHSMPGCYGRRRRRRGGGGGRGRSRGPNPGRGGNRGRGRGRG